MNDKDNIKSLLVELKILKFNGVQYGIYNVLIFHSPESSEWCMQVAYLGIIGK